MSLRTRLLLAFAVVVLIPIALITFWSVAARAEVVRIEVASRADVLNGKEFGTAGPYERILGKVLFTVDPKNPQNKNIPNIDKAPRNAEGMVEFSSRRLGEELSEVFSARRSDQVRDGAPLCVGHCRISETDTLKQRGTQGV